MTIIAIRRRLSLWLHRAARAIYTRPPPSLPPDPPISKAGHRSALIVVSSTPHFSPYAGFPCRVWEGRNGTGVPIRALIPMVSVDGSRDADCNAAFMWEMEDVIDLAGDLPIIRLSESWRGRAEEDVLHPVSLPHAIKADVEGIVDAYFEQALRGFPNDAPEDRVIKLADLVVDIVPDPRGEISHEIVMDACRRALANSGPLADPSFTVVYVLVIAWSTRTRGLSAACFHARLRGEFQQRGWPWPYGKTGDVPF